MRFIKNRFVLGCFCIILAFAIGCIGVPKLIDSYDRKVTVVMAKEYISKGSEIQPSMLTEYKMSIGDIPYSQGEYYNVIAPSGNGEKAFFASGGEKMYASCDIYPNDVITSSKASDAYPYSDMEIRTLDNNHYAVTANVSSLAAGVAGKVRSGDVLTLLIYSDNDVFIDSYLNYVRVISVSNSEAADINDSTESDRSRIPAVITFEATLEQAMYIAKYNNNNGIHYALAARADTDKAAQLLSIQEKMLTESHARSRSGE